MNADEKETAILAGVLCLLAAYLLAITFHDADIARLVLGVVGLGGCGWLLWIAHKYGAEKTRSNYNRGDE